ncbi:isoprenoid synthase domain-containing protein [Suillus subluteus]|nr:isoprenoid synthase domain-containing protein [Suillus subluteus]
MASTTTCTVTCSDSKPSEFIIPDFFSNCRYPVRLSPHYYPVSGTSGQWLCSKAHLVEPKTTKYTMSLCADDWLEIDRFNVNDAWGISDCCMPAFHDPINFQTERYSGMMCKLFFSHFKQTGGPGCTTRFIHSMDLWFISVAKERAKGHVNNVESYIKLRHDLSGIKPCFALIEFASQIDLPDEVISHLVIMTLEKATNDFVAWSNEILSYNMEQSHHSTHNLVAVLMINQGLDLQGEGVDKEVAIYVQGLQNWIPSSLQWSFESTYYFRKDAHIVKQDRTVKLLPKRPL